MKKKTSENFDLVYEDFKKALFNSLVYGSPLIYMILTGIQDGKSFEELESLGIAWILQAGINLTIKFMKKNTYKVK